MPSPRSLDLLVRAAQLYYEEGRSQHEVAAAIGVSGSSVSRILAAAREQGIVVITVRDPRRVVRREASLEVRLAERFGLSEVRVATVPNGVRTIDAAAVLAARFFAERVEGLRRVGLGWGVTVDRFAELMELESVHPSLTICPLVGGLPTDVGPAGNTSMEVLATRAGATSYRFESPAVVESRQTWAALQRESSITAAIRRAELVEFAMVGIGCYGQNNARRVVSAMRLTPREAHQLSSQSPAGDICGRFFDIEGRPLGLPTLERVIGVSLDQLRKVPKVVAVAAGAEKSPGVLGALRTGVLDGIVLDEKLALAVLELADAVPIRP